MTIRMEIDLDRFLTDLSPSEISDKIKALIHTLANEGKIGEGELDVKTTSIYEKTTEQRLKEMLLIGD